MYVIGRILILDYYSPQFYHHHYPHPNFCHHICNSDAGKDLVSCTSSILTSFQDPAFRVTYQMPTSSSSSSSPRSSRKLSSSSTQHRRYIGWIKCQLQYQYQYHIFQDYFIALRNKACTGPPEPGISSFHLHALLR